MGAALMASAGGCRTVDFSAPGLSVPVFVGPIQPRTSPCAATRITPVTASSYDLFDSRSPGPTDGPASIRTARASDQMVSLALESATGYCEGCWVHLEELSASHIDASGYSRTLVEGSGRVTHIISEERGSGCDLRRTRLDEDR